MKALSANRPVGAAACELTLNGRRDHERFQLHARDSRAATLTR